MTAVRVTVSFRDRLDINLIYEAGTEQVFDSDRAEALAARGLVELITPVVDKEAEPGLDLNAPSEAEIEAEPQSGKKRKSKPSA